jgi:hypothetical protein
MSNTSCDSLNKKPYHTIPSTAIEIIKWVKKFAGQWRLEAGLIEHRYASGCPGPTLESKQ